MSTEEDERYSQDAIARLSPVEPSHRLKQIVADIPNSHPRAEVIAFPFKSAWVPAVSLAAAALLGLFVGQNWVEGVSPAQVAPIAQVGDELDFDEPNYEDLDTDHLTKDADFAQAEIDEPDLEDLLVIATTGGFDASNWTVSQWESTDSAPPSETPEEKF